MSLKTSLAVGAAAASLALGACTVVGDDDGPDRFATRAQIVDAAARCGVPDFEPTKAGGAWAAYVKGENPDHGPKGDCIYADLKRHGLIATR